MEHFDVSLRNPSMNREFWTEFLDIYKSEHCLWNFKSKAYLNKNLRQRGYERLLEFLRRGMPDATIDTVKSKINTFRTNYRKQMKKLTASRLSSECDEYEPTLWYFNCLRFLSEPDVGAVCNGDAAADGVTVADVAVDTYDTRLAETDDFTPQQLVEVVQTDEDDAIEEDESRLVVDTRSRCSTPSSPVSKVSDVDRKPAKRRREELSVVGEAVTGGGAAAICNGVRENGTSHHQEDECELLGRVWASKLRRMPDNLRPFVEKQVNDIFFNVIVAVNEGRAYPAEHGQTAENGDLHHHKGN
ncbi:uncharacterized protein LOC111057240 [Nilaparvata lugens]|uniref:uncharacterized protein LOC111057240 n=1 Tax=Nilaparvata lugens TaxID=108931 RepID=UPI00193E9F78|nr:uncharacterized protein LOC111057240 [Nilaparvata lugens]